MITRRFGRTELDMPVFSTGGMRYQMTWKEASPEQLDEANQANLIQCIDKSLSLGCRHIETARGYGSSEYQLGFALQRHKRDDYILQTKVAPTEDPKEFLKNLELSFELLKTERVDLFAFHGVNLPEHLDWIIRAGGCLDAIQSYRDSGRIGHIGFSTHGRCRDIQSAIQTGVFDYVNLHWYTIDQTNRAAIEDATSQDMGVFIISPNDKGGMLYQPTESMNAICDPLSPMVYNDLFCLSDPKIHTLSLGVSRPSDFDEHLKALPYLESGEAKALSDDIYHNFKTHLHAACGSDLMAVIAQLPTYEAVPHHVNLKVILRLWSLYKAFGMETYGKMRYNLLGNGGHWFPGIKMEPEHQDDIRAFCSNFPEGARLYDAVHEACTQLVGEEQKRLSETD